MQVREILSHKGVRLLTVTPDMMISTCVATMAEEDIGSLVVIDGGKLAGMLTFREVLKVFATRHKEGGSVSTSLVSDVPVRQVMVTNPQVIAPDMDINELRRMMIENHSRYLPVMDGQVLMGVVSFHDVAKAVLSEQTFENRMLKAYIGDYPAEG